MTASKRNRRDYRDRRVRALRDRIADRPAPYPAGAKAAEAKPSNGDDVFSTTGHLRGLVSQVEDAWSLGSDRKDMEKVERALRSAAKRTTADIANTLTELADSIHDEHTSRRLAYELEQRLDQ